MSSNRANESEVVEPHSECGTRDLGAFNVARGRAAALKSTQESRMKNRDRESTATIKSTGAPSMRFCETTFYIGLCFFALFAWVASAFGPYGVANTLRLVGILTLWPGTVLWGGAWKLGRNKALRRHHVGLAIFVYVALIAACCRPYAASVVHLGSYEKVEKGMTRAQVQAIMKDSCMGGGGKWGSAFDATKSTVFFSPVTKDWRHDSDIARITFENDRVTDKEFLPD